MKAKFLIDLVHLQHTSFFLTAIWLPHSQGDSLTNPMLITVFYLYQPEGRQEPHNKVGSLSQAERLAGFEPGTFQFSSKCLNPLDHSPLAYSTCCLKFTDLTMLVTKNL